MRAWPTVFGPSLVPQSNTDTTKERTMALCDIDMAGRIQRVFQSRRVAQAVGADPTGIKTESRRPKAESNLRTVEFLPTGANTQSRKRGASPPLGPPCKLFAALGAMLLGLCCPELPAAELFVSPAGSDENPGTLEQPLATLHQAQRTARQLKGEAVTVYLRGGTYYLSRPLVFTPQDSGTPTAPVTYCAWKDEQPVISGGMKLELTWREYRDGIMQARLPERLATDQLFCNGRRQHMARYPNVDPKARYFNGFAPDCISPERAARWKDPAGAFFHAMHRAHWGDLHYVITGKDAEGNVLYEGGWQNNRPTSPHAEHRFVENVFEELDAPGEWFHDRRQGILYFYPPEGVDLRQATIEGVRLEQIVEFRGNVDRPVRWIVLRGLKFVHAARTFMKNKEPLLRSDWTTWRGGAVYFERTEDCRLEDLHIDQVGSNAVFVSGYNRRIDIRGCRISRAGASAICFVGLPEALRSPLFNYGQTQSLEQMDHAPGPKTPDYPAQCRVYDCLLDHSGRFEKQTAGVNIAVAADITVSHCTVYGVPRAGINICVNAFGGHVIEYCDVFDTVLETGDHGSFNSWGRDRYWHPNRRQSEEWVARYPDMVRWDACRTTLLRNNRWRCDFGWDIDLDDGSSNYHIYNNLCLSGGIKLREGYHRVVENNVMVNNTFHPHVWYHNCDSAFQRNIVFAPYAPARMSPETYGRLIDYNFHHMDGAPVGPAAALQKVSGADEHSLSGDARFVAPEKGDYRVREDSPALRVGFRNFPMEGFGVVSLRLRAAAQEPVLPGSPEAQGKTNEGWGQGGGYAPQKESMKTYWRGALIKNVQTAGEQSATGLDAVRGVLVVELEAGSAAAALGLREGDVILEVDGTAVKDVRHLLRTLEHPGAKSRVIQVWRDQKLHTLSLPR